MNAYVTGSRAYGYKYCRPDSDIDLAVLVDRQVDLLQLWECSISPKPTGPARGGPLMYGNMNLVVFSSEDPEELIRWHKWRKCHDYLCANPPETKGDAIKVFREAEAEKQYHKNQELKKDLLK